MLLTPLPGDIYEFVCLLESMQQCSFSQIEFPDLEDVLR